MNADTIVIAIVGGVIVTAETALIVMLWRLNRSVRRLNDNLDLYVGGTIDKLTTLSDKVSIIGQQALAWLATNRHVDLKTNRVEASIDIKNGQKEEKP